MDMDDDYREEVGSLREARKRATEITGEARAFENKGNHFLHFKGESREIYVIRDDYMKIYWE